MYLWKSNERFRDQKLILFTIIYYLLLTVARSHSHGHIKITPCINNENKQIRRKWLTESYAEGSTTDWKHK